MLAKKDKNIGSKELFKRCCFRTTKDLQTGLTTYNSAACFFPLLNTDNRQYILQSSFAFSQQ